MTQHTTHSKISMSLCWTLLYLLFRRYSPKAGILNQFPILTTNVRSHEKMAQSFLLSGCITWNVNTETSIANSHQFTWLPLLIVVELIVAPHCHVHCQYPYVSSVLQDALLTSPDLFLGLCLFFFLSDPELNSVS